MWAQKARSRKRGAHHLVRLLLAPEILIAIFLLVNPSDGVADPLSPSKKPRELSVASVAGPKLLKTSPTYLFSP
jgi:hypothetical protein